jgi:hypothetical protein
MLFPWPFSHNDIFYQVCVLLCCHVANGYCQQDLQDLLYCCSAVALCLNYPFSLPLLFTLSHPYTHFNNVTRSSQYSFIVFLSVYQFVSLFSKQLSHIMPVFFTNLPSKFGLSSKQHHLSILFSNFPSHD